MSDVPTTSDMADLTHRFTSYLVEVRMRSHVTTRRYTAIVTEFGQFLAEQYGRKHVCYPLEGVTKNDLIEFLRLGSVNVERPSRSAWNLRLAALRAFFDFLVKTERVNTNPAQKIDRLKPNPREPVPLSFDEFLALVDAMQAASKAYRARNVAIVQIFFHTALRVEELASLNVGQVDFDNRMLLDVRTKGDKLISLPFNDLVSEALERYLAVREKRAGGIEEPALFLSNRRRRMSVRTIEILVKSYAKRAGITRDVTPHLLRHSGATSMVELGVPIRVVQEICGHRQITTTERYTHVRQPARRHAIETLGKAVKRRKRQRRRDAHAGELPPVDRK